MRKILFTLLFSGISLFTAYSQISLLSLDERRFGIPVNNENVVGAIETGDGGMLLCANYSKNGILSPAIIRVDENNDTLWTQNFTGMGFARKMRFSPDGNVMILTTSSFFVSNFNGDSISLVSDTIISDIMDFQFKSNGEIIGIGMQTTSGIYSAFTILALFDSGGNFQGLASAIPLYGNWNSITTTTNGFIVAGDNALTAQAEGTVFRLDQNGSYLTSTNLNSATVIDLFSHTNGNYSYAVSNADPFWVETRNENDTLQIQIQSPNFCAQHFSKVISLGAKGYLCFGSANGSNDHEDVLMAVRYSMEGDSLWSSVLGTGFRKELLDVINLGNNSYFISGYEVVDTSSLNFNTDVYYARLQLIDPEPEIPELDLVIDVNPTLFTNEINFTSVVLVPDLVSELVICDVNGKKVTFNYDFQPGNFKISFPEISNGTYFYRMIYNGKKYNGKLVRMG